MKLQPHDRILFQGDSITHAYRVEDPNEPHDCYLLGAGYAGRVAGRLQAEHPAMGLRFWNRGVCGNNIPALLERWNLDTICLEPDVLSLLIGVNDAFPACEQTADQYEQQYRRLLEMTRAGMPHVRLILLEPFALFHGMVTQQHMQRVRDRQPRVRRIADDYDATFVPLQELFDTAVSDHPDVPPTHWTLDGVHPSAAGHHLIAQAWLNATQT